jgi:hypothetical protein
MLGIASFPSLKGRFDVQQLVAEVLSAWRRAERLAEELASDDPARDIVSEAAVGLKGIYLDLTAGRATEREPETPITALRDAEMPG